MTLLYPNDIFEMPDGTLHRLLYVAEGGGMAWVIALKEKRALPVRIPYAHALTLTPTSKRLGGAISSPTLNPSRASEALRDRAWERIAPLVANTGIFESTTRGCLLRERASQTKCSQNTLLKDLRRYWQGGQTRNALLGDYANSGRVDSRQQSRGRHTKTGKAPFKLQEADRKVLDKASKFYLKKEYRTLDDAYQWMLERYYTYADGNGESFIKPALERPTLKQLSYWLKTRYTLEHKLRARKGNKDFERDHRQRLGSIQLDCHGAGHMYEIDATIADVYLVSSSDRTVIVGKPTLYLIIDRATRLIVGWYVGYENPCWSAAMQAILSIAEDKATICKRHGITYDPADWPAHGVQPEMFLADQGEMASKNARRITNGLRAMVTNVPGLRPDWKPLVECGFKMMHQVISPDLPAYDPPSNQKRRRGKAYYRDATLNLEEFTSLIIKAIVTHNRTMQTNFELSVSQVAEGVRPVPRELWFHEIRTRVGALARFDADTVRLELLPRETGTVTDHGIEIRGCTYTFPEAEKKGWFVQARNKRFKVDISLDYRLCDEVLVHDPDMRGRVYTARLTPRCAEFRGMSFAEVAQHISAIKALVANAEQEKRQNRFDYHKHSTPIIEDAERELRTASQGRTLSRNARKKNIAHDRATELQLERSRTAGVPSASTQLERPLGTAASVVRQRQPDTELGLEADALGQADPNRPLSLKEKAALHRKKLMLDR